MTDVRPRWIGKEAKSTAGTKLGRPSGVVFREVPPGVTLSVLPAGHEFRERPVPGEYFD